jgi:hypothetical protein
MHSRNDFFYACKAHAAAAVAGYGTVQKKPMWLVASVANRALQGMLRRLARRRLLLWCCSP